MSGDTAVWIIVAVVVLVAIGLVVALLRKRDTERKAREAQELRSEAAVQSSATADAEREAARIDAEAQLARAESERAEARATEARQGVAQSEAVVEDKVREADRLDPDVDHTTSEHQPDLDGAPSHRGEPTEPGNVRDPERRDRI